MVRPKSLATNVHDMPSKPLRNDRNKKQPSSKASTNTDGVRTITLEAGDRFGLR